MSDRGVMLTDNQLRAAVMRGGAFMVARQLASLFLKLIGVLLIARVLGPETYGAFAAAAGVCSFALAFGQAGIGVFLLRYEGELGFSHYGVASTLLAGLSLAVVLTLELAAPLIAGYVKIAGFLPVFQLLILAIPLQIMILPAMARLERALDYRAVASIELSGQCVYYLLAVPMAFTGYGAMSLACAFVIQHLVTSALAYRIAGDRPRLSWDSSIACQILRYSVSFSIANSIWQLRRLVNPLVVGPLLGAQAVGIVGMTVSLLDVLSAPSAIAWRVSVAALARVQQDARKMRRAVTQGMELQLLAIGSALLGFGWFGDWLMPWVFGARWMPVLDIYPYVALGYLTMASFNTHSAAMSVLNRNDAMSIYHVAHIAFFAGVAAVTVGAFGMRGYGLAELATLPAYLLLHAIVTRLVGSPDYRVAALWWSGVAIGLFWRDLGVWAVAAPFVALLAPRSREAVGLMAKRVQALP